MTSTLQQEASSRLGSSPSATMSTAQQLYEGVDGVADGAHAFLDSSNLSETVYAEDRKRDLDCSYLNTSCIFRQLEHAVPCLLGLHVYPALAVLTFGILSFFIGIHFRRFVFTVQADPKGGRETQPSAQSAKANAPLSVAWSPSRA
jgi:hypothetical protein